MSDLRGADQSSGLLAAFRPPPETLAVSPDLGTPLQPAPDKAAGLADTFKSFVKDTRQHEGFGADPHSSAVSGFMPKTFVPLMRQRPDMAGKSDDEIISILHDNSPEAEQLREWATGAYAVENGRLLQSRGLPITNASLQVMNIFGPGEGPKILSAPPGTPMSQVVSEKTLRANDQYVGLTTDQVAQHPYQSGHANMAGQDWQWGQAIAAQSQAMTAQQMARTERDRAEYMAAAEKAPDGSPKRMEMLEEAHASAKEAADLFKKQMSAPPVYKPADMFAGFGGVLQALTLLAGRKSAQPLTATMNMTAALMDGTSAENKDEFDRAFRTWDKQTDYALKLVGIQNQDIRNIMDDQRMAEADKQAHLRTLFSAYEMDAHRDALERGNLDEVARLMQSMASMQQRAQEHRDMIALRYDPENRGWQVLTDPANKDDQGNPTPYRYNPNTGKAATLSGQSYTPGGAQKLTSSEQGNKLLDADTVKGMAEQYLAGDRTVMQNLGRGAQGAENVVRLRAEIIRQMRDQGKSGADIATKIAEFEGLKAGERALGTRTAQMGMALNETKTFAPLAIAASEKVDRSQFPALNQLLLAAEKGTGDENVVRLAVATNSLLNAYARAVTPTGVPTEGAQNRARELLDAAWSQGQYKAAINQLMLEVEAASRSPGMVREEFRERADPGSSVAAPASSSSVSGSASYKTPDDVYKAFDAGKLTKDQAKEVLLKQFGYQHQ